MNGPSEGLDIQTFTVDKTVFKREFKLAGKLMEPNKAVGLDGIHVEMLKANAEASADLLTMLWQVVGRTKCVPQGWLSGVIVPLYKGKGDQNVPVSSLPIRILSHIRKLVKKAVVLDLDRKFETDRAYYGFQAGIQDIHKPHSVFWPRYGR